MKRPTFFQGVLVALALSLAGGAAFSLLAPLAGFSLALRVLIAGVAFAYVLYLFSRSDDRTGRVVTTIAWLTVAAVVIVFDVHLAVYLLIHVIMVWLIRSLYFHSGVLAALLDLGLNGLAAGAFVWAAANTGSVFLSTWCFFLVHALFVAIPPRIGRRHKSEPTLANTQFARAQRNAEAALRRLLTG